MLPIWLGVAAILAITLFSGAWDSHRYLQSAALADGVVTSADVRRAYDRHRGSYTVTDIVVRYEAGGTQELKVTVTGDAVRSGDSVQVLYQLGDPGDARLAYSKWQAPALGLGGVLLALLAAVAVARLGHLLPGARRDAPPPTKQRLVTLGASVRGPARVERVSSAAGDAWFVLVDAYDPHMQEIRRFRSELLDIDPSGELPRMATVFLDPDDPHRYWVQVPQGQLAIAA